jgi:hypothetical protein
MGERAFPGSAALASPNLKRRISKANVTLGVGRIRPWRNKEGPRYRRALLHACPQ